MSRYRKKPVVIDAVQWTGKNQREMFDFLTNSTDEPMGISGDNFQTYGGQLVIKTLEGNHNADPGDMIIKGIAGEFYPCKPEIFTATYELVL